MPKILEGMAPAMVTPFTADDEVNVAAVGPMVEHHIAAGMKGFIAPPCPPRQRPADRVQGSTCAARPGRASQ